MIQFAKLSGFSPVITTASKSNEAYLKSLGATHVIDRSLPASTIAAEVAKIVGGKPVEFAYDAISLPDTQALGYDVLAPGGVLLLTLAPQIPEDKKNANTLRLKSFKTSRYTVYSIGQINTYPLGIQAIQVVTSERHSVVLTWCY